jgi:hypothetical protein
MIVASVNAKKCPGAMGVRERFRSWLERREVTLEAPHHRCRMSST